ncbi:unnamed protein product [Adineta steineri]|uniref:Anti-proliferative protein domain-containing protein n=1 Tax=Adineta steineri TaxID=433720 RepID=A0A813RB32_9BILA|nr:unnamed protein product [Adineta steineri]CAF0828286.1 unnamed protein product [Adineta steineri]CAF0877018.1 unnamed protein product [Adineta steineri]
MTHPRKELTVACSYLLRLMKAHVELSTEQINVFKRTFHDILSKRYIGHWFPATPNRGSAYRCLQTKYWKDPVLKSIADRSCIPLHRYLPIIFTMWIDPGEVAVCFGDDGTWCPLYKQDMDDDEIHQEYSDGEETVSCFASDDDLSNLTQNIKTLNIENKHIPINTLTTDNRLVSSLENSSCTSSPLLNSMTTNTQFHSMNDYNYSRSNDWNVPQNNFWCQQQQQPLTMSDGFYQEGNF